ncbi:MAG: class I SAM-dependent methyltransferase, partial [Methylococcales bacterium]|nr:class I SAM-dependent methyltransferase [Methylococcales bacterium]
RNSKLDNSFGRKKVDRDERERLIRQVFDHVAPRYDLMNDAMSFGIHRLWKNKLVAMARPDSGQVIVDLAGGTGDVAVKMMATDRLVVVADPSLAMIRVGQKKHQLIPLATSGERLALADESVDTLTIAFGVRNMTKMQIGLQEIWRVLNSGGRLLCLEFSTPGWWLKPFYDLYSYHVIPRLGAVIAGQPEAYTYLIDSIRNFPDQEAMKLVLQETGFDKVAYTNLSFGIACIHTGSKPV